MNYLNQGDLICDLESTLQTGQKRGSNFSCPFSQLSRVQLGTLGCFEKHMSKGSIACGFSLPVYKTSV